MTIEELKQNHPTNLGDGVYVYHDGEALVVVQTDRVSVKSVIKFSRATMTALRAYDDGIRGKNLNSEAIMKRIARAIEIAARKLWSCGVCGHKWIGDDDETNCENCGSERIH